MLFERYQEVCSMSTYAVNAFGDDEANIQNLLDSDLQSLLDCDMPHRDVMSDASIVLEAVHV